MSFQCEDSIDVAGIGFTANKNIRIQSVPRDLSDVTSQLMATATAESSGKFQTSFTDFDLGGDNLILLVATDDNGITATGVYAGGCP